MKIAILGAGAMGSLYGAGLSSAGEEVTLIATRKEHIDALNEKGLVVQKGQSESCFRIQAGTAADYEGTADAVFLFTKGADSEKALQSFRHAIGPDTLLISLQNGIGHEVLLKQYADDDHIFIGTTNFPSDRVDLHTICLGGSGVTKLMSVSGKRTPALAAVIKALEKGELEPEAPEDIRQAIWEKAAFNAALNSLTAVTRLPQGILGRTEEGKELIRAIIHEVCFTANRKGIPAREEVVTETAMRLLSKHEGHYPSMLQDVLNDRMTEIEYINGAAVRAAEELGIRIPVTETLYRLVSIAQQTYAHHIH